MTEATTLALRAWLEGDNAPEADGLEPIEDTLAALHHDVGKYVTRIARNVVPGSPVPASLWAMLCKDLYETHRGTRASQRFAQLAGELPPHLAELPPLCEARQALARIDAAEPAVRGARPEALAQAIEDAREVDRQIALVLGAVRSLRRSGVGVDG